MISSIGDFTHLLLKVNPMTAHGFVFTDTSNTPAGAEASMILYSLIITAKANGLNPYNYLKTTLENSLISKILRIYYNFFH